MNREFMSMQFMYLQFTMPLSRGGLIKAFRKDLGLSQQAFATKLGISMRSVAHYEAGRVPGAEILSKMMDLAKESNLEHIRLALVEQMINEFDVEFLWLQLLLSKRDLEAIYAAVEQIDRLDEKEFKTAKGIALAAIKEVIHRIDSHRHRLNLDEENI